MCTPRALICLILLYFGSGDLTYAQDGPAVGLPSEIPSSLNRTTVRVMEEVTALVTEAETLIEKVQSNEESEADTQSADLRKVRNLRTKLARRLPELRSVLDATRGLRVTTQTQLQAFDSSAAPVRVEDQLAEINREKGSAELELKQATDRIANLKTILRDATQIADKVGVQGEIDRAEQDSIQAKYRIERAQREISRIGEARENETPDIENLRKSLSDMSSNIDTGLALTRRADDALEGLDDLSDRLLQTEILDRAYTERSTLIFGLLVAAVIIGFFGIAFRSKNVQEAIFTGDSGIQFVTLFSLVIAIILFGILGILEGKELAALLGGLSGYILGRSTPVPPQPAGPSSEQGLDKAGQKTPPTGPGASSTGEGVDKAAEKIPPTETGAASRESSVPELEARGQQDLVPTPKTP